MTPLLLVIGGIAMLLIGGSALVRGASGIAAALGISPLMVGLTVVAFGTSAPELVVTVVGALTGYTGIAFGNVVGSNLANLGLVLGISALVTPIMIHGDLVRREVPLLLLATCVILVVSADLVFRSMPAVVDRADGAVLILLFLAFLYITYIAAIGRVEDPVIQGVKQMPVQPPAEGRRNWLAALLGAAALAVGGHLIIDSGPQLAKALGVAPMVVGLFFVAIGTSLPELTCSVIAAVKQEPDLCVGNVVGSNLFNGLMVLPAGALLRPMPVPSHGTLDLALSLVFALALIPIFIIGKARLGRPAGFLLLGMYGIYAGTRVIAG